MYRSVTYTCSYSTDVLDQAFREKEHVIILEHEGKKWRVDLDKEEQRPVDQPSKRRKVRIVKNML